MTALDLNRLSRHRGLALATLAAAAFVFVTSETMPIGLLPQIHAGLRVSDGRVGLLMTIYAAVAAVTAIPFTAWTTHLPRRALVITLIVVYSLTQFGAAAAPSYTWLVVARVVAAMTHGLFWSVVAPVAVRLSPGAPGRATSAVFAGTSLALVIGSPATTVLGQLVGWRASFVIVGAAGLVTVLALAVLLPHLPGEGVATRVRDLGSSVFASRSLLILYAITVIVVIGHFAAYTYIAPIASVFGGLTGGGYSALLFGYGLAGMIAVAIGAKVLDTRPRATFLVPVAVVAVALAALFAIGHGLVATVVAAVLWGGAFTVMPSVLQSSILRVAPQHGDTASAVYVVAFQIGIGGGAWVGGVLADSGHVRVLPLLAAIAAATVLVIGFRSRTLFPSHRPQPAVEQQPVHCA